jgi:alkylation response protein AidB-like acyl-CoA dehydrogenase
VVDDGSTDLLAGAVDEYLRSKYDADVRRQTLATGEGVVSLAASLADLGAFAVALGDDQGGLGLPLSALGPIFMQYGRYLVAGPMLENSLLPALLHDEVSRDFQKVLADVVENGSALSLLDPGVTDHWSGQLGVVTSRDGLLYGSFDAARFAAEASVLVVVAEGEGSPELWLVDPASPGLATEPVGSSDPTATFSRVVLDGVAGTPVNDQRVVPALLRQIRLWSRVLIACELSGIATHCVELSVAYAKQREQFGRPIGSFQAIKHILADMHTHAASLRSLCKAVLADLDAEPDGCAADVNGAALKAYAATVAVTVCEDAVQVHGGIGFTAEADIHWYYKRALALRAWYGETVELQEQIGEMVLDLATRDATARS